jgi:hypothetical protein
MQNQPMGIVHALAWSQNFTRKDSVPPLPLLAYSDKDGVADVDVDNQYIV